MLIIDLFKMYEELPLKLMLSCPNILSYVLTRFETHKVEPISAAFTKLFNTSNGYEVIINIYVLIKMIFRS